MKTKRKPLPHFDVTAAVIRKHGRLLIAQRPFGGRLGGLWEFPGGKVEAGETLPQCLRREIKEELGVRIKVVKPIISIDHAYTHFKITLHAFECELVSGNRRAVQVEDFKWVRIIVGEVRFRQNGFEDHRSAEEANVRARHSPKRSG